MRFVVYPTRQAHTDMLMTADNVDVSPAIRHLLRYLIDNGQVEPLREYRQESLGVTGAAVLADLQAGGKYWEAQVPEEAAELIKQRRFFDYAR